ncbi:MFS transporter [Paucibacter sp. APW11]|uniref:MFS transporter n=1 Tax=Roseateles aquae TaxID=3077235 RepID=A0ABU3PBS8_9BURK|nr:MFS transporter [Paucibacter sp. APW11]MDT9000030.1 MFS transporter [Paucibacter sp. APW11]
MATSAQPHRAWKAQLAVTLAALASFAVLYCTQALLPALQQRYGLSLAESGSLLMLTLLGLSLTAPFSCALASHWSPRPLLLLGLLGLAVSSVALGLCRTQMELLTLRLLQGLLLPLVLAALLGSLPQLQQGMGGRTLSASYVCGTVLGGVLGRALPAALLPAWQWPGAFAGLALLQGLLALLVWRLLPADLVRQPAGDRDSAVTQEPLSWALLWRAMRPLVAAGFCLLFAQASVFSFIVPRLSAAPWHWSASQVGALYLLFLPSAALVHVAPWLMRRCGVLRLLLAALGLSWVGLLLSLSAQTPWLLLGLGLFALAVFVAQAGLAELVGRRCPAAARRAAGIYLSAYYLGGACGAVLPAWVWDRGAWPGCLLTVAAVQLLLLLPLGWRAWRHGAAARQASAALMFSCQKGSG